MSELQKIFSIHGCVCTTLSNKRKVPVNQSIEEDILGMEWIIIHFTGYYFRQTGMLSYQYIIDWMKLLIFNEVTREMRKENDSLVSFVRTGWSLGVNAW